MSKARDLADFVSAGSPLADGTISVSEVSGAAPTASPTFTGSVESEGNVRINTSSNPVLRFAESGTLRSLLTSSSTIGLSVEAQSTLPFVVQTNGAERMRIDSSGNLLVGTSNQNWQTEEGMRYFTGDSLVMTRSSGTPFSVNRLTDDGDLTIFRKDGTTVGSIGSLSGFTYLGSGDTGLLFVSSDETIRPHNTTTNVARDNAISLGESTVRFKDAHFAGTVNAAIFNSTSDATLKTNVETLSGSLDAVKAMRGVSFDWIDSGNPEIGVIAQEVEEVLPELVNTNDNGIKSVKYGNIVAVLIEAIKEQQEQIDELKAQLNS